MAQILRPSTIGTTKQVFFDNEIIDGMSGIKRTRYVAFSQTRIQTSSSGREAAMSLRADWAELHSYPWDRTWSATMLTGFS